ncbi:MAG: thioredoxin [Sarcina sp.]
MVKHLSRENFKEEVIEKKGIVVVDFWAPWCGPCKMLGPMIDQLNDEMANVEFTKVNVDEEERVAEACQISNIPTILIFKDGEMVDRLMGFKPKADIIKEIEKHF